MPSMPCQPAEKLCCFPLESGIKYWGWISVVLCSLSAVSNIALLFMHEPAAETEGLEGSLLEMHIIYSVMVAVSLLGIGTSYMMVMAVNQRKRSYLLPYMISNLISIVFWTIVLLPLLLPVFLILSPLGILLYLCYCVYSLFLRLKAEEEHQTDQFNETSKVTSPQYAN